MNRLTQDSTVYLISCVSKKIDRPAAAKELYASEWFLRARDYADATGCPSFILSAMYGLVSADEIIHPYDQSLNYMSIAERRAWAANVQTQMDARLPKAQRFIVFAGQRYREFLIDYLRQRAPVEIPLERLRIGEQLSWFRYIGPSR
jgi:hypothetical protein